MAVALVTGSAKGIGKALLLALAKDGYDVAVNYLSSPLAAEKVVHEARAQGVRAISLQANVNLPQEATMLVQNTYSKLGRLDVLINNVGNYYRGSLESFTPKQWQDAFNNNLHSTFYTCQAALALMRANNYGRIINIGFAGAGKIEAKPNDTAYSIAKAGIIIYSKTLAKSVAKYNITVNVISPGIIENSVLKPINAIPMKRLGSFDEMVGAMHYFLSAEADYITGAVLEIAGGWSL